MQVVLSLRVGGLERVVVDLVNNTSPQFCSIVCCLEEAGNWAAEIQPERGKVVVLGKQAGFDWRLFRRIQQLARRESVAVIHTHNSTAHLYGAIAGRLAGIKILHTEHGKNIGEETRHHRLNRIAAPFTNCSVVVSEQNARVAIAHEGVRTPVVIPNGINVKRFGIARPTNGRRIGSVGRLVREKNYPLLIRAMAGIADTELVFVGDGPLREELVGQVSSLPLAANAATKMAARQPRVQFLGSHSDIPELLAGFDVFVLSSSTEGMSIALLEAMAAACPIVVTAVGGNTELIQQEVTGLVVPPDDETALRAAIERLLDDRALAQRLGETARKVANEQYSIETMTRRYEELWRRLAK